MMIPFYSSLMELNINLFYFININLQNSFFNFLMPLITDLGTLPFVLILCLIILEYGLFKKDKKIMKLAILGLIALLFPVIITYLLKILVGEPRPFVSLANVHLLVIETDPNSFPSGHTSNSFALAIGIGLNWEIKIKQRSIKLAWFLIPIASIIGFSRIYIGVHYPFDVITGAIIGIIGGLLATKIGNSYLKNCE
ncbi:undecaprenyl-diphosphatase BcrC [Methanobrevibacter cuticularis]|uniref:Undecaprenyl-diphosphatase BcrC n=2 Tax=Methanobrevibacter cuticularis TaxID=47311 RepID=A0A166DN59_9EURY|nr:undecaprenyl-diphosphatase BcrC [Methanobrevibacter cuticularis]